MRKLALGLILALLVGCGGPQAGVVVRKEHHPARTYTWMMPQCVTYGKYGCTMHIYIPHVVHDDEDWVIKVEVDGKLGTVTTTKRAYDSVDIGGWFDGPVEADRDKRTRKG